MASTLGKKLNQFQYNQVEKVVDEVVRKFLIPKFRSYDMNASGKWLNTIEARENAIWGQKYTKQLVDGRKGGSMPPVGAIKRWVKNKIGLRGAQAESMAWAVATKIKQSGTTWYRKGGTDLLEVLESNEVMNYMNKEIAKKLNGVLEIEFTNELKKAFA